MSVSPAKQVLLRLARKNAGLKVIQVWIPARIEGKVRDAIELVLEKDKKTCPPLQKRLLPYCAPTPPKSKQ